MESFFVEDVFYIANLKINFIYELDSDTNTIPFFYYNFFFCNFNKNGQSIS